MSITAIHHKVFGDGYSVLVNDSEAKLDIWIDVEVTHKPNDCIADWHDYVFPEGSPRIAYQADDDNFEEATSVAIKYLEERCIVRQGEDATWVDIYRVFGRDMCLKAMKAVQAEDFIDVFSKQPLPSMKADIKSFERMLVIADELSLARPEFDEELIEAKITEMEEYISEMFD